MPHQGTGRPCEGELSQTATCKAFGGEDRTLCGTGEPQDAKLTEWSEWGGCSASCGGGQMVRQRTVDRPSLNGGQVASGALEQTMVCSLQSCTNNCEPVSCMWGMWSEWSACDRCGGERRRFRHVLQHPRCGGEACAPHAAEEVGKCARLCHEPTYCGFGDWSEWGLCSATCGSGVQARSRSLQLITAPKVLDDAPLLPLADGELSTLQQKYEKVVLETKALEAAQRRETVLSFGLGLLGLVGLGVLRSADKGRGFWQRLGGWRRADSQAARAVSRRGAGEDGDADEHVGLIYRF